MDVLIIGAGAAGLSAAVTLRDAGVDVQVVEARTRVGGRAWTLWHAPAAVPIELGAEFVHGGARFTERLAGEAGALIVDVAGDQWRSRGARLVPQNDFWSAVGAVMVRLREDRADDRSFGEFLRQQPGGRSLAHARTLARAFVQGFHAADVDQVSERALAGGGNPGRDDSASRHGRLTSGYGPLLQHLAEACTDRIRFGTVVRRIRWKPGGVEAEVGAADVPESSDVLAARAVIITVPLSLLQERALLIDPEPAALRACAQLRMGSVVRVSLLFEDRFWENEPLGGRPAGALRSLSFLHTPGDDFNIWWTQHPIRAPLITGWSGGPPALGLASGGDVEGAAIRALSRAFGMRRQRLERRLAAVFTHDWQLDPFSRGAYSYAAVGGADAARRLARAVRGTLFFAGEATSHEGNGTVEGALESGRRAAGQLLRSL